MAQRVLGGIEGRIKTVALNPDGSISASLIICFITNHQHTAP